MEEVVSFDDARFQAMKAKLLIRKPKDLVCAYQNPISKMCIEPTCFQNSLHCDREGCKACEKKVHNKCQKMEMEGITELLNTHASAKKQILQKIGESQKNFVSALMETNHRMEEEIRLAGLKDKQKKIVEEIYDKRNDECLKGKGARLFLTNLKKYEKSKPVLKQIQDLLKLYDKTLERLLESAVKIKEKICKSFSVKPIRSIKHLDSNILGLHQSQTEFLNEIMNDLDIVKKANLIFRASEHGFRATAFHEHCDGKKDTLVLIKNESGKVFGGYTHYPWDSNSGWVSDNSRRTYIFSMDMREKFVPQENQNLICRNKSYGPMFGGGHDIFIYDECNSNSNSHAEFPNTYNREGENKLKKTQENSRIFSGGKGFKVVEYQVYQLFYE